jgi:GntR family transcriptional regulator
MVRLRDKPVVLFNPDENLVFSFESEIPLWKQLEKMLNERIQQRCAIGSVLPGEMELAKRFNLSRATVRRAYDSLINKGIIERRAALGTRVIGTPFTHDLGRMKSFTEDMHLKGISTLTELVEVKYHQPSPILARQLELKENERVLHVGRLRGHSKCFPLGYLTSELPESLGVNLNEDYSRSLYQILENDYNIRISHGVESIRAGKATDEEASRLHISIGEPVLIVERLTYQRSSARPIEFARGVYRHDHYAFSLTMRR